MPSFRDELFFLSNMYPCPFSVGSVIYNSSEHFFQSCLALPEHVDTILAAPHGWAAKRIARTLPRRADYKKIQIDMMAQALYFKFSAHGDLRIQLMNTPDEQLYEFNEWHDNYWGHCTCTKCKDKPHLNNLGKLLKITKDYFLALNLN